MKTLNRILSVITLFTLMSVPALLAQEDRQYDPQTDDQGSVSEPDQSAQPDQPEQSAEVQQPAPAEQNQQETQVHGIIRFRSIMDGSSATLPQSDYGRVPRHPPTISAAPK